MWTNEEVGGVKNGYKDLTPGLGKQTAQGKAIGKRED